MNRRILLFIASYLPVFSVAAVDLVADVEALPGSLTLYPRVSYAQLELTIAGDGFYWKRKHGQGEDAMCST